MEGEEGKTVSSSEAPPPPEGAPPEAPENEMEKFREALKGDFEEAIKGIKEETTKAVPKTEDIEKLLEERMSAQNYKLAKALGVAPEETDPNDLIRKLMKENPVAYEKAKAQYQEKLVDKKLDARDEASRAERAEALAVKKVFSDRKDVTSDDSAWATVLNFANQADPNLPYEERYKIGLDKFDTFTDKYAVESREEKRRRMAGAPSGVASASGADLGKNAEQSKGGWLEARYKKAQSRRGRSLD